MAAYNWFRFHNIMIGLLAVFSILYGIQRLSVVDFFRVWLTGVGLYFACVGGIHYFVLLVQHLDNFDRYE
jgi:hypothetical protein